MKRQLKRITIVKKLSAHCVMVDDSHAQANPAKMCTDCHPNDRIIFVCLTQLKWCICFIGKKEFSLLFFLYCTGHILYETVDLWDTLTS